MDTSFDTAWESYVTDMTKHFYVPFRDSQIEFTADISKLTITGFNKVDLVALAKWCNHHNLHFVVYMPELSKKKKHVITIELQSKDSVAQNENLDKTYKFPAESTSTVQQIADDFPNDAHRIEQFVVPFIYYESFGCKITSNPTYCQYGHDIGIKLPGAVITQQVVDRWLLRIDTALRLEANLGFLRIATKMSKFKNNVINRTHKFKPY